MEIKAIPTIYNGYKFRSRLEARWAVYFDEVKIQYEYEPEGLVLSDGTWYLPDFYLPEFRCFFEVKRKGIKGTPEGDDAIRKISDSKGNEWGGIITFGDPMDEDITLYCRYLTPSLHVGYGAIEKISFVYDSLAKTPCIDLYYPHSAFTVLPHIFVNKKNKPNFLFIPLLPEMDIERDWFGHITFPNTKKNNRISLDVLNNYNAQEKARQFDF